MTMRPPMLEEEEEVQLNDDLEQLLWDINEFCGKAADKQDEIPGNLETYIKFVARTGNTVFPWQHVRPLFRKKMLKAINDFGGEPSPVESFIFERFDIFRGAPFTIQRLAELITNPKRHYKVKDKYLRGLEKTVLVVTTIEPSSSDDDNANQDDSNPWMESVESDSFVETPSDIKTSVHADGSSTTVEELQEGGNVAVVQTVDVVDGQVEELPDTENMDEEEGQGISGTTMPTGMNTSAEEVADTPAPPVVIEEIVSDPLNPLIPSEAVVVEADPMEVEATAAEVTAVIETVITPELYAKVAEETLATVEAVCGEQDNLVEDLLVAAATSDPTPIVDELLQPEAVTPTDSASEVEETPVSAISEVIQETSENPEEAVTGSDLPATNTDNTVLNSDVVPSDDIVNSSS